MATINLEKAIEEGRKITNSHYDLPAGIMLKIAAKGGCDAVAVAFTFGYYQGTKAAKAEMKKKTVQ